MRVVLVTTNPQLDENGRIAQEVKNLGYEFVLYNLREFEYKIIKGKFLVDNLEIKEDDIVIPRAIFRSVHQIAALVELLRKRGIKVFDNNFLKHKFSINKLTDIIRLSANAIPIPDCYHFHSFEKYFEAGRKLGYPLVIKLTRTGKGVGVIRIDDESHLRNFIEEQKGKGIEAKNYLVQKFIPYKLDLRVLIIGKEIFCMQRIPKEGEFRANYSLGGKVKAFELDEEGKKLALSAKEAVDLEVAGVDMLITENNERYILEVNHTPGMLGMEEATGKNITGVYIRYAIDNAR